MRKILWCLLMAGLTAAACAAGGTDTKTRPSSFRLDSLEGIEPVNVQPEVMIYRGRRAVRLLDVVDPARGPQEVLAILSNSEFKDGTIEADLAGMPRAGAPPDIRGFIGIAFRVQEKGAKYECFYLRMTNGRADDQLRRNHSAQYVSAPDFPWSRLRKENPGMYESYVDLDPGAWTKVRIVVSGAKAQLYVNGAAQPSLVVSDLKLGESGGQVALWLGDDTEAYFSNLSVK